MSDLAELTGFAQRYAEAWCSLVTSLISSYELWKIDNGTGGSRERSTGGPGSRPERSAVDERGRESINFFAELKRRLLLQSGGGFLTARSNQHPGFSFSRDSQLGRASCRFAFNCRFSGRGRTLLAGVPAKIREWMDHKEPLRTQRVMHAVMEMKKLDMAAMQRAYDGK